jgi:hypothetical protein
VGPDNGQEAGDSRALMADVAFARSHYKSAPPVPEDGKALFPFSPWCKSIHLSAGKNFAVVRGTERVVSGSRKGGGALPCFALLVSKRGKRSSQRYEDALNKPAEEVPREEARPQVLCGDS